jgi:hypothetical protein
VAEFQVGGDQVIVTYGTEEYPELKGAGLTVGLMKWGAPIPVGAVTRSRRQRHARRGDGCAKWARQSHDSGPAGQLCARRAGQC